MSEELFGPPKAFLKLADSVKHADINPIAASTSHYTGAEEMQKAQEVKYSEKWRRLLRKEIQTPSGRLTSAELKALKEAIVNCTIQSYCKKHEPELSAAWEEVFQKYQALKASQASSPPKLAVGTMSTAGVTTIGEQQTVRVSCWRTKRPSRQRARSPIPSHQPRKAPRYD